MAPLPFRLLVLACELEDEGGDSIDLYIYLGQVVHPGWWVHRPRDAAHGNNGGPSGATGSRPCDRVLEDDAAGRVDAEAASCGQERFGVRLACSDVVGCHRGRWDGDAGSAPACFGKTATGRGHDRIALHRESGDELDRTGKGPNRARQRDSHLLESSDGEGHSRRRQMPLEGIDGSDASELGEQRLHVEVELAGQLPPRLIDCLVRVDEHAVVVEQDGLALESHQLKLAWAPPSTMLSCTRPVR